MITVRFEAGDCLELSIETFVGAHLKGISFHRAIFEGLDFSKADFTGCDLRNSVFYFSVLNDARMINVSLVNAILIGSKMRGVNLSGSLLMYSDFSKVDFSLASLKGATVVGGTFETLSFQVRTSLLSGWISVIWRGLRTMIKLYGRRVSIPKNMV